MKQKIDFSKIIDYVTCFLLIMLAIKKGGFYKSDTILFNLVISIIAVISVARTYIVKKYNNSGKKIGTLLLAFSVSYLIPIILKNYSSLNDGIFEMIRYFNVYLIYNIVKNSDDKKIYKTFIILVAVILVLFGIDQIASGYLGNILLHFNSGYLTSNNIDRMSSTIQYANVFALICLIAGIFILDNMVNKKWSKYINNLLQFIVLSGIFLSGSRVVIILTLILLIYYFVKYSNIRKNILFNFIYTIIYVAIVNNLITNNLNIIYAVTAIAYILLVIIYYLCSKIDVDISKIKYIKYILTFSMLVFVTIALSIHTNIYLNSDSNKSFITRNIYNCNKDLENNLKIEIDDLEEDTRYEIGVFQVSNSNEFKLVDKLYYYSTTTGIFDINIQPIENLKYINININCTKGSLNVKSININNKEVGMNYLLLPSNLVYRVIDSIYNSNSSSYRLMYQKDALKMSTSDIKNFMFGIGGEGFRNGYKYYQTQEYNSTEVHNIYIQILLESGILGLTVFLLLIIHVLKRYKFDSTKLALICIFIHGVFDLDFSYMIILAIFGILLGLLEQKENYKYKHIEIFSYIKYPIVISMFIITTGILVFSNIATMVNLYNISEIDSVEEIQDKLVGYEKIVSLDRFETKYRIRLNEEYTKYIEKLLSSGYGINSDEVKRVVNNLTSNLNYLQLNESTNTSNLIDISNQYLNNLYYLVNVNYIDNINLGYDYYLSIIYNNMFKMYSSKNRLKEDALKLSSKYIKQLKNIDNEICDKYEMYFKFN